MSVETLASESSSVTATPAMEISRGPLVNLTAAERTEYRKTGELPKPPNTEATATSSETDSDEGDVESAGASGSPSTQEKPEKGKIHLTAKQRVDNLRKTIARIEKEAGLTEEAKPAETSTAKPATQSAQEPPPKRPKPTADDKKADGTPKFDTYEDFIEDLGDWRDEQREAKKERETAQREQSKALLAKVDEAKARYSDFADVVTPTVNAIVGDEAISPVVKAMLDDSEVFADLIYTIGSNKDELARFIKMAKESPRKAMSYIVLTESLIAEELEGKNIATTEEPPVKPKTSAPRPPSEAGGRASAPPDAMAAALAGAGGKLTPAVKAEMTRQALARLKT